MFPCHQRMPNVSHFGFNESTLYTESVHFLQQHKIFYGLDTIVYSTVQSRATWPVKWYISTAVLPSLPADSQSEMMLTSHYDLSYLVSDGK